MAVKAGKWGPRVTALLGTFTPPASDWRQADRGTIGNVLRGISPYSGSVKSDAAARVVFNISSAHVPSFVAGRQGRAYRNRYDIAAAGRLGSGAPSPKPDVREAIDRVLARLIGRVSWKKLYYGAVELNGAGIRYYGDVCLVLKTAAVGDGTVVLDRNSFDLICAPLRAKTHTAAGHWDPKAAKAQADDIAGEWAADLADMAICKVLKTGRQETRRITVGAVSEGVLDDEDYMEVIRTASFDVSDVDEARLAAADAAVDGLVADRLRRGPAPDWTELLWRNRRRQAERALKGAYVRMRVVVSTGRVRS
jgi:hypothetical protein